VLGDVNRGAAILTAECQALDQPKRDQNDRRGDVPGRIARQQADEEGADAHQGHGDQEGVFAADQIAEATEDQRAERVNCEARCKRQQRENESDIRRHIGEKVFCQEHAERPVDVEVVPFEDGIQRGLENDLSLFSRHSTVPTSRPLLQPLPLRAPRRSIDVSSPDPPESPRLIEVSGDGNICCGNPPNTTFGPLHCWIPNTAWD
jgi:hypothetical protein